MFRFVEDKPMGAVSAFTDRNLSLPTSEQLLLVRMVLEPFLLAWMESEPLLLAWMESEQLLLARMVYSSCFLLGWRSEQLLLAWMVCFCASFSQLCWCHGGII